MDRNNINNFLLISKTKTIMKKFSVAVVAAMVLTFAGGAFARTNTMNANLAVNDTVQTDTVAPDTAQAFMLAVSDTVVPEQNDTVVPEKSETEPPAFLAQGDTVVTGQNDSLM